MQDPAVLPPAPDRLVTRPEAATILGISPGMVRKMQNTGALPLVKVGRAARVRSSDLYRLIAASAPGGQEER